MLVSAYGMVEIQMKSFTSFSVRGRQKGWAMKAMERGSPDTPVSA